MNQQENFREKADEILYKATIAAAEFQQLDQVRTDKIVEAVYKAGLNARIQMAKMAVEETGIGIWQDKVIKNVVRIRIKQPIPQKPLII